MELWNTNTLNCATVMTSQSYEHCQLTKSTRQYTYHKGKGKVAPVLSFLTEHHAMKAYWGSYYECCYKFWRFWSRLMH